MVPFVSASAEVERFVKMYARAHPALLSTFGAIYVTLLTFVLFSRFQIYVLAKVLPELLKLSSH